VALAVAGLLLFAHCATSPPAKESQPTHSSALQPPVAERDPKVSVVHGDERVDEYRWLRNRDDPRVIAYLEAENHYTEASTAKTKALREQLFEEMKGRIKQDDSSVPQRKGEYFYFWRTEDGKQYRIECRKKGSLDATEEVILDQNEVSGRSRSAPTTGFWPTPRTSPATRPSRSGSRTFAPASFCPT